MQAVRPASPDQLAEALHAAASERRSILLGGRFSKGRLGQGPLPSGRGSAGPPDETGGDPQGPFVDAPESRLESRLRPGLAAPLSEQSCPAEITVSTCAMNRLLRYDPRDLTISAEAGMTWAELQRTLAERGQMLPLDPAWATESTVGGVVAANLSGPRRRLYGTARDMIIGMTFATLEGKLVQSGGNVVKNVAGLDMAKLMIGSFGTLAAIATINFKVFPVPPESQTFVTDFESIAETFAERDRILQSALQPAAIDIVNWPRGYRLLIQAAGSAKVIERYARELARARMEDDSAWEEVREFTSRFLARNPEGVVVPIVSKLSDMAALAQKLEVPFVARAGSGVIYAHYAENPPPVEFGGDFAMMTKVKEMFDPERLLNRGRLYGRI